MIKILNNDKKIFVTMSGGIDSSTVVRIVFGIVLFVVFSKPLFSAELDKKHYQEPVVLEAADFMAQGQYDKAEEILEQFLAEKKALLTPYRAQEVYSRYAEVKSAQRKYKEAVEILQQTIKDHGSLVPNILENLKECKKLANKPQPVSGDWPEDESSCVSLGGKWNQGQMPGTFYCDLPTQDAGKECQDFTECQGFCAVEGSILRGTKMSGKCSGSTSSGNGCANIVIDGVATGMVCD